VQISILALIHQNKFVIGQALFLGLARLGLGWEITLHKWFLLSPKGKKKARKKI
jgi:hypothetical protein